MIQSIIDRLQEAGTPFRIAGGAGELANVKDQPPATPAFYAYIARERSAPSDRIGRTLQRSAADVAIVIVTSNLSKQNNAAAAGDIEALKTYVRNKLIGFMAEGATDPFEHVEGELQQALGGTVWFEDVFTNARYLEEQ